MFILLSQRGMFYKLKDIATSEPLLRGKLAVTSMVMSPRKFLLVSVNVILIYYAFAKPAYLLMLGYVSSVIVVPLPSVIVVVQV